MGAEKLLDEQPGQRQVLRAGPDRQHMIEVPEHRLAVPCDPKAERRELRLRARIEGFGDVR